MDLKQLLIDIAIQGALAPFHMINKTFSVGRGCKMACGHLLVEIQATGMPMQRSRDTAHLACAVYDKEQQ